MRGVNCNFEYVRVHLQTDILDLLFLAWKEQVVSAEESEPLKIMISGAPASGKGTQCELITQKVSLFCLLLDIDFNG